MLRNPVAEAVEASKHSTDMQKHLEHGKQMKTLANVEHECNVVPMCHVDLYTVDLSV